MEYAKVDLQQASSYKFSCNKSGLILSVDPYIEEERIDKVFHYDLLTKGILPLLVVFENKNAEDGYILLKDQSKIVLKHYEPGNSSDELDGEFGMAETISDTYNVQLAHSIGLFLIAGPIISGLVDPAFETRRDQLVSIANNINNRLLTSKIVYPGGSHSGFLYLKFSKEEDIQHVDGFLFSVKNIRSNEVETIKVEMH